MSLRTKVPQSSQRELVYGPNVTLMLKHLHYVLKDNKRLRQLVSHLYASNRLSLHCFTINWADILST